MGPGELALDPFAIITLYCRRHSFENNPVTGHTPAERGTEGDGRWMSGPGDVKGTIVRPLLPLTNGGPLHAPLLSTVMLLLRMW